MKRRILILLLTVCIFSASNNLIAQWIRCGPDNGPVNCLSSIDNKLFAGTDGGVFLSMDSAETWSFPMTEIWCSEVMGFAVMGTNLFNAQQHEGGVYRSVNYGSNWTKCGSGLPSQAIVSLAVLDSWIFAGTQGAGVYRSGNLGDNWIAVNTGLPEDTITSFAVIGDTIFAGTWGEGLFLSSDYGANWIPVTSGLSGDTITALAVINNMLYAGTYAGQVFRSDDNGDSWIPASAGLSKNKVTCFASAGNIIIAGTYDGIYRSSDNGEQWIPANTGVVLREARALHTMGDKLFLATIGGIYRSTNNGETWTDVSSGMKNANIRALVMDGTTLYTATWGGGLFLSRDGGDNWESYLPLPAAFSIAFTDEVFYVGGDLIHYTSRSSTNWKSLYYQNNWIYSLAAIDNTVFVGFSSGGLFRTKRSGSDIWESVRIGFEDTPVNSLLLNGSTIYAGTGKGVYSSVTEGEFWVDRNNGLTNIDVRALILKGTDLFAGTFGGGVFRSTDNGYNWIPVNNGLTNMEVLSFAVKNNNLFAGTWNGGVFLSTDNGSAWTPISDDYPVLPWFKMPGVVHGLAVDDSYIYAGDRRTSVWRRPLSEIITSINLSSSDVSSEFTLKQNFPNPFNSSTKIRFSVPHKTHVFMKIFDQSGKEVISLLDKEFAPGTYEESFDGKHLSAGVYYYQMQAGEFIQTRKLVLLR